MRVAWLTGASWRGGTLARGELPTPDGEDFALVAPVAAARGVHFEIARWDDDLTGFDAALIRSTWDYHQRVELFHTTLAAHEAAGVKLFNPASVVRWNARKTYLQMLADAGAPTIPTLWADRAEASIVARAFETFEAAEIVIKPQLGAGSRNTIRLARNGWSDVDLFAAGDAPVMIQPFLPAIQTHGESSLFYFGGKPAHVIRKRPAHGKWYANVDGAVFERGEATPAERTAAEAVLELAPQGMLYARIDLVDGADGRPRLIELEAIEPYLFLGFAPEGVAPFVEALREAVV
jgi:glutathione synthase/RimK-type ligase-like ATP-grasp enzyme